MSQPLNRAATWVLSGFGRKLWGMTAGLMPVIVEMLGPVGAIGWYVQNMPGFGRALKAMGPLAFNLGGLITSLFNGCSYCTYAYGRAFELHYFEQHGKLFPLDDHELISLIPLTDEKVRNTLVEALLAAGLRDEVEMFNRIYALKLEGAVSGPGDEHLLHLIQMSDTLNYCGIRSQMALDDAHDPVNKDTDLKARYSEARLQAGRRAVTVEDLAAIDDAIHVQAAPDGAPVKNPPEN